MNDHLSCPLSQDDGDEAAREEKELGVRVEQLQAELASKVEEVGALKKSLAEHERSRREISEMQEEWQNKIGDIDRLQQDLQAKTQAVEVSHPPPPHVHL